MVVFGSLASSAAIATPSIAKKNQMAKGIAATIPGIAAMLKSLWPAQPLATKLLIEKPGDTTPINTSSSTMAKIVTNNSKVAAICTPMIFKKTKIT